jgi:hypothetical protein
MMGTLEFVVVMAVGSVGFLSACLLALAIAVAGKDPEVPAPPAREVVVRDLRVVERDKRAALASLHIF